MRNGYGGVGCLRVVAWVGAFWLARRSTIRALEAADGVRASAGGGVAKVSVNNKHPLDPALRSGARRGPADRARCSRLHGDTDQAGTRERRTVGLPVSGRQGPPCRRRRESGRRTLQRVLEVLRAPAAAGREVIWVQGKNEGKLVAHESGFKNFLRVNLDPNGFVAMMGNRYPISDIGMFNLVQQLIVKGRAHRQHGECEVQFFQNAKVDGRPASLIQVTHPERRPYFEFYRAQIFIDQETEYADPLRGLDVAESTRRPARARRRVHLPRRPTQRRLDRQGFRSGQSRIQLPLRSWSRGECHTKAEKKSCAITTALLPLSTLDFPLHRTNQTGE